MPESAGQTDSSCPAQDSDFVGAPARYAQPDYSRDALVTRVWVPDDGTVGWLVFQEPDSLEWFSVVSMDHLGYGIRRHVSRELRDGVLDAVPASTLWARLLADTLHTDPETRPLAGLLDEIRAALSV